MKSFITTIKLYTTLVKFLLVKYVAKHDFNNSVSFKRVVYSSFQEDSSLLSWMHKSTHIKNAKVKNLHYNETGNCPMCYSKQQSSRILPLGARSQIFYLR